MKRNLLAILLLFFLFAVAPWAKAQKYDKKQGGGKPDPELSLKDNDYIDRQDQVFLDTVQSILAKYSPLVHDNFRRTTAKMLMDAVFHDHFTAYRKPVQQFFHARVDQVIQELEQTKVEKGVRIWKIYNMGFIARTKTVTLAFDLVSGSTSESPDFSMNQDEMDRIVRQCDALLISHRHEDHADIQMAQKFVDLDLPVLTTEETWSNEPIHSKIIHPERSAEKLQHLKLKNYTLDLYVFPGHQLTSAINNVYLVKTPEGITLAHDGDQINEGNFMMDWDWIDQVHKNQQVDVLMTNAWTTDIFRVVRGFNPELVLPGHEIELGHTVWDRLPYWGDDKYLGLNYAELKKSKYPVVAMIWGESYWFIPRLKNQK
ncbi:MAG: MBL fold metallo-hydrolase [Bacteroidota bacterium]|nr:MBL fold metallo-hydrolase [Bacteroidota bacterium]